MDALAWLQAWYTFQCDGAWEDEHGLKLETVDNPGWLLTVDLEETPLEGATLNEHRVERNNDDWLFLRADGRTFTGAGGARNLLEVIESFRRFAESSHAVPG